MHQPWECPFTTPDPARPNYRRCPECGFGFETEQPPERCHRTCPTRWHLKPGGKPPVRRGGAGTEVKRLLHRFRLYSRDGCNCDERSARMDAMGTDWCEEHLEEIVGWLREEAKNRGLPFVDAAGQGLVRLAIHIARKKERNSIA